MKTKIILIFGLLIIGSILCWWFLQEPSSKTQVEKPLTLKIPDKNSLPTTGDDRSVQQQTATTGSVPVPPKPSKSEQMTEGLSTFNHRPIEFYGKVIDQFGVPVGNALIKGTLLYNDGLNAGVKKVQTQTKNSGDFEFTGLEGKSLSIEVEKDGYQMAHGKGNSFVYSLMYPEQERFTPDKNKPYVIEMWKKQGAAALIQYEKKFSIPMNGAPITIDLQSGTVNGSAGDLRVKFTRNPLVIPESRLNYEWDVTVEVLNGGLVEIGENDEMPEAPIDGYKQNFNRHMVADAKPWDGNFSQYFFVKSQGGKQYGKIEASLFTGSRREIATLNLTVWLNPSGSRNLEYDPAKRINK